MDAEVANCRASKHGSGQSVKFLTAREHIDNQLYALDLCLCALCCLQPVGNRIQIGLLSVA